MKSYLVMIALAVVTTFLVSVCFLHREANLLDRVAAAEVQRIEAEIAKGAPLVRVIPGPVRFVERERIVVQRIAPEAEPVLSAEVKSGGETTGAPTIETGNGKTVECPNPLTGCETNITGWRTEAGNVVATGTQTRWWQWPGKDRQESTVDLTVTNTKVNADPRLLVPDSSPRWIAGFSVGLDDDADKRASVYALRRIGTVRSRPIYASGSGMVGAGDVVVAAGLAVGW